MQLLSVVAGQLLRAAVLMATSQTTKPLCKHRLLEKWSVEVQFFKDILAHLGLFSPAFGEKSQGIVGSSILSRVKRG